MRELTAAERKAYDKMILGSKQMNIKDFLKMDDTSFTKEEPEDIFPLKDDSKVIYSQMELFK